MMAFTGLNGNQTWLKDRLSKLLAIRAAHPALRRGLRSTLRADSDVWVFSKQSVEETVYVAINRGDAPASIGGLPGSADELVAGETPSGGRATVPGRQTRIYIAK